MANHANSVFGSGATEIPLLPTTRFYASNAGTYGSAFVTGDSLSVGYIDPHAYGAKGDAIGLLNAVIASDLVTVTCNQYQFKQEDVGKECHISSGWETGGYIRIIGSVSGGAATLATPATSYGTRVLIVGTDDTDALEAAFDAAAKTMLDVQQLGAGADPAAWGPIPLGGTVKLHSGKAYLVRNTQFRYDAGKIAAIMVPRHCGLEGGGMGQSAIYLGYGNIGHGIANWSAASPGADERISLSKFTIFGNRANQPATCLDNIYWATSMGGYTNVDNFSYMGQIQSYQSRRNGFYLKGRGEMLLYGLWSMNAAQCGYKIDVLQDSRFLTCNAGGCGYAGFWVGDAASCAFDSCKSFYNGASGSVDLEKTCNWFISDANHSYLKGSAIFTGCESQESRGSGWYIKGGNCQYVGCLTSDPKRSAIGSAPRPYPAAGIHLDKNASNNVFDGFYVRPALKYDWGSTTENHYGGDYAVYIGYQDTGNPKTKGPRGNKGNIYTLEPTLYDYAKVGGPGVTNALNGGLYIDGDPLPSDVPDAPVLDAVTYGEVGEANLDITAPTNTGGRAITNYIYQYKISSDSTWIDFYHFPNANPAVANITGLTDSLEYHIRCAAVNNTGQSAWSNTITHTHIPTVPHQVSGVVALVNSGQIHLSWTAPLTGGSAITDYLVEYKTTSGGSWATFTDGVSAGLTAVVTGLTNNTSYDFRVSAINVVGTGASSSVATAVPLSIMGAAYHSSLLGYYDAFVSTSVVDGGDGTVESFLDISGRADNNLTQETDGNKPSAGVESIGTGPGLGFDGTNDSLVLPSNIVGNLTDGDFTVILLYRLNSGGLSKTNALLTSGDSNFLVYVRADSSDVVSKCGADPNSIISITPDTNPHVIVLRKAGTTLKMWYDGQVATTVSAANIQVSSINMGLVNQWYGHLNGAIGAAAFYNDDISHTVVNAVVAQWASNYGFTATTI